MEDRVDFLGDLARELHCAFLSDLHRDRFLPRARSLALAAEPGRYPLDQWQDVVGYLLDWAQPLQDEAEARRLLTDSEKRRNP